MAQGPGSIFGRLVGACISLMVAAIAFNVAVTIIRPYVSLLAVVVLVVAGLAAWRAWQRNRW